VASEGTVFTAGYHFNVAVELGFIFYDLRSLAPGRPTSRIGQGCETKQTAVLGSPGWGLNKGLTTNLHKKRAGYGRMNKDLEGDTNRTREKPEWKNFVHALRDTWHQQDR